MFRRKPVVRKRLGTVGIAMVSRYDPSSVLFATRASPVAAVSAIDSSYPSENRTEHERVLALAIRRASSAQDDVKIMLLHLGAVLQAA
jgi:hypothetical protein